MHKVNKIRIKPCIWQKIKLTKEEIELINLKLLSSFYFLEDTINQIKIKKFHICQKVKFLKK